MPTNSAQAQSNTAPEAAPNSFLFDAAAPVLPKLRELYPPSAKPRSDARGVTLGAPIDIEVQSCVLNPHANRYVVNGFCSACDRRFVTSVEQHRDTGIHLPRGADAVHTGVEFKLPSRGLLGVRINPAADRGAVRNLGFNFS